MNASCISSNNITSTFHVHASYFCIWLCIDCRHSSFSMGPAPETFQSTCLWSTTSLVDLPGKQTPLFIPIQSYSLAPALIYCIRTTTIQLLLFCCGSWTHSSAWPIIATVNSWNPLAWVGVAWALMCLLIHACFSLRQLCLELCQVWFIENEPKWWTCPTDKG